MSSDTVDVVPLSEAELPSFNKEKLIKFFMRSLYVIPSHYQSQDPNRLTLLYFTISGLDMLGALDQIEDKQAIIDWVYSLQVLPPVGHSEQESGQWGFRGSSFFGRPYDPSGKSPDSVCKMDDGHIAMTYSAICILVILGDDLSRLNRVALLGALRHLQTPNGSFSSTCDHSESDLRFLFCACAISAFLNDWSGMDVEKARQYIVSSMGYDFAYGQAAFQESHGGSTYCAIASLALMGRLGDLGFPERGIKEAAGYVNASSESAAPLTAQAQGLLHWLVQRQVSGFQGRINKDQDSCYSWWVGASLQMLGYFDMVESVHLRGFLLSCQHPIGGFAKYPDHHPDALHTYFSLCGLAFIGEPGLQKPHCALGISLRAAKSLAHLQIE